MKYGGKDLNPVEYLMESACAKALWQGRSLGPGKVRLSELTVAAQGE